MQAMDVVDKIKAFKTKQNDALTSWVPISIYYRISLALMKLSAGCHRGGYTHQVVTNGFDCRQFGGFDSRYKTKILTKYLHHIV